ncbi:hypothetical protein [Pontivivens insulae]|uniref:Uncharacterized protein n=1 Tax=Pontivivens insulae TaxID=1639689 RepID=A0A2R8AG57_9RHOB|nr:hypothetical protein [Pontivivens insulae]RED12322.1 hypothetical protein DFR53_3041 [Pontivivens insulae]SPF31078.1 hypothetical protein POI8812_03429 [Pontivivens insulae]
MMQSSSRGECNNEYIYVYQMGPFANAVTHLLFWAFLPSGLALFIGGLINLDWKLTLFGLAFSVAAVALYLELRQNKRSSGYVRILPDKVQLPMTAGLQNADFLYFSSVVEVRSDWNHDDHEPALIVSGNSHSAVYKMMYFDRKSSFDNFCHQLEDRIKAHKKLSDRNVT